MMEKKEKEELRQIHKLIAFWNWVSSETKKEFEEAYNRADLKDWRLFPDLEKKQEKGK